MDKCYHYFRIKMHKALSQKQLDASGASDNLLSLIPLKWGVWFALTYDLSPSVQNYNTHVIPECLLIKVLP